MTASPRWLVLGATGRLGRAIGRLGVAGRWMGVARRPPHHAMPWQDFAAAARQELGQWQHGLEQADAILDLCAFDAADAAMLVEAAAKVGRYPRLVVASSIADRPVAMWSRADDAATPWPEPSDTYGFGKRAMAEYLRTHWRGPLVIARLPMLLAADAADDRAATWLHAMVAQGHVDVGGDGQHRPAWLDTDTAAALLGRLAEQAHVDGTVTLGHPAPARARDLAAALGPALGVPLAVRTGQRGGILGGGDEPLEVGKMLQLWPALQWRSAEAMWQGWARATYVGAKG